MHTLSGKEIRDRFLKGEMSAVDITQFFLARIEKYEGKVDAFLSVFNERALKKAKELDQKKAAGKKLGKLAGIPIAVKDNIHVKGEISTCGSNFLKNYRAPFDSTAVRLLEGEDGIIIGKTNMDEFAMGSSTEHSAFKLTKNPWNLKCVPGGSSGGSAAAVAARLCPISLGSDTGGSIRQPAAFCGITGFKPTYGRVSRFGLVAFGSSLDQIGPLTTNVADASLVMEVLGKHCEYDSTSISLPSENYLDHLTAKAPLKLGVPWQLLEGLQEESMQAFKRSLEVYQSLGYQVLEVDLNILKYSIATYYILANAEASTNLARFDGIRYGVRSPRAQTLDDVYDLSKEEGFGAEVKRRILLGTFVLSSGYQDAYYKKAQKVRALMIQQMNTIFAKCDLVAIPVSPFPAFELGAIQDPLQMYLGDIYTLASNLTGTPAISIPCGFTKDQKPIGLQLIGPQTKDLLVAQAAHAFEKATDYSHAIPELFKE